MANEAEDEERAEEVPGAHGTTAPGSKGDAGAAGAIVRQRHSSPTSDETGCGGRAQFGIIDRPKLKGATREV
jgi:hypothetical protein